MALAEGFPDAPARRDGAGAGAHPADAAAGSENFPVASRLLAPRLRGAVVAFYRFARSADDLADDPALPPARRRAGLLALELGLSGVAVPGGATGLALRGALGDEMPQADAARAAAAALMAAFHRDSAGPTRCADWADLMGYCRASAAPVGRFLLAIHDEGPAPRAPSDALCAALQVLNHLQDLGADWRDHGRRYLPGDWMAAEGAAGADLGAPALTPALARVVARTLEATDALLDDAAPLPGRIAARGLRAQAAATLALARRLRARLGAADPLAGRVALGRGDFARAGLRGLGALL